MFVDHWLLLLFMVSFEADSAVSEPGVNNILVDADTND
jgi:hypothetical protein